MSRARILASLLDSNNDVVLSALDNVSSGSNDASALTTGTLSADRIGSNSITAAKLASTLDLSSKTLTLPDGVTLPSQTNNSGKYLTTNGSTASWVTVTTSASTPTAVSDQANSSTGYFGMPKGTSAQRVFSAAAGSTRFNTTTGSLEFYNGSNWISTNLVPTVNSISGTISSGTPSTLTLSLTNATDTIDVKYYKDTGYGSLIITTDSGVTVTSGSATLTVPSAVYGQTSGTTIRIYVVNADGNEASSVTTTVS